MNLLSVLDPEVNPSPVAVLRMVVSPRMETGSFLMTMTSTQSTVMMTEVFSSAVWIPNAVVVMFVMMVRTVRFRHRGKS